MFPSLVFAIFLSPCSVISISILTITSFAGIELHVYGGAFIRWTEKLPKGGTHEGKTEVEHTAEEIYVDETYVLWGQGENHFAGKHKVIFKPVICVSSK